MLTWLLVGAAWAADCPDDPATALREGASWMSIHFAALDEAGFDLARAAVQGAVPCLVAPLDAREAVLLHRAMALAEFADGDMVAVRKSYGAVRALDPAWEIPTTLVPPGHLLRELFAEAPAASGRVGLDLAPDGGWWVDGGSDVTVPSEVAFVLQGLGKQGAVVYTGYHTSVADIPVLDFAAPGMSPRARRMRIAGTAGGGGLLLAGAGLVALGQVTKGTLGEVAYDRVEATRGRAEAYGVGGVAVAAVGVGLGTAVWAVRW